MLQATWDILLELAPWLLLGAAVAGAMQAFLPARFAQRLFGGGGVWKSVLLGVPLPLCSCAVIPVGLGLKRQGASDGSAVAFLTATPQTGVDSVLVTAGMLGWPLALWKVVVAMVTGLLGGWLTDAAPKPKSALPIVHHHKDCNHDHDHSHTEQLASGFSQADELIRSIWGWLVLGVLVSAAITVYSPQGSLESLASYGGASAMLMALLISLPLYVCATASVPIAASLVAAGAPAGAAIVFLMAGPATNVATVGAVYRTLGWKALVIYLTVIILGSITGALVYESLFTDEAILSADSASIHVHEPSNAWWRVVSAVLLVIWLAWCAVRDLRGRFAAK